MGLYINLNGEFVESDKARVSVFDHGLLYGDGIFEGIRAYDGRVFRMEQHINRLYNSADAIKLTITLDKAGMEKAIIDTLRKNNLKDAYIRVVVTRGVGDLGLDPARCSRSFYFIITHNLKLYPEDYYEKGLRIITSTIMRNLPEALDPRVKSLNYLNNILAKLEATKHGVLEAIMLNYEGYVAECTGDNIFMFKDGKLTTPPTDIGALEGITRDAVLEIAKKACLNPIEDKFKVKDIYSAEECFLTGTGAEIIPVVEIDGKKIGDGKPGKITRRLIELFREATKTEGEKY
ncbi:MAG: branched-chain-amino-acid transaminase [Elusimicrobiota bacterium]